MSSLSRLLKVAMVSIIATLIFVFVASISTENYYKGKENKELKALASSLNNAFSVPECKNKYEGPIYYVLVDDMYDPPKNNRIGECMYFKGFRVIRMDSNWMNAAKDDDIVQLLAHEMGHCVMSWDHSDWGLMTPYLHPINSFILRHQEIIKDECIQRND